MRANRNAVKRYGIIDKCLRNRARKWTWKDILNEVNDELDKEGLTSVGKTTLFEDLKDIEYRVYNAEIEKHFGHHKKIVYYRYADPEFSINKQPLSENEANQIKSAIQILSRFKGMPQFEWVNELVPVLETRLNLKSQEHNIISFDNNEDYHGKEHISAFFNAILYKRVLKISYQNFKTEFPVDYIFHPYHLKQYNSRWFVFGFNPDVNYPIQNLALDRIVALEEITHEYIDTEIDWDDYFSDIIGVSKTNAELTEIKLLIKDQEQASYIKTKPIHQSQKIIRKTDLGFESSIKVIPNYELYKIIMSFGSRIKVLSPPNLVEKIKNTIEDMQAIYEI
jgi:predicted DNA-binding transcriptional regulator YafY